MKEKPSSQAVESTAMSEEKTTSEIAGLLGLSERTIQRLSQQGVLPKKGDNLFDLKETIQAYIAHREKEVMKSFQKEGDAEKRFKLARAGMYEAKERKEKILADLLDGNSYDAEAIDYWIQKSIEASRAKLLSIPSKVAPALADLSDPEECRKVLHEACREAAQALADFDPVEVSGKTREIIHELESQKDMTA